MFVKLAWKNVWRNKVRSLILAVAVTLGLWSGLTAISFSNGILNQMIDSAINTEYGHIQIHNPSFNKEQKLKYTIPQADNVISKLKKYPGIDTIIERTVVTGMAASPVTGSGVTINGIEPDIEGKSFLIKKKIVQGDYFKKQRKNTIVIGKKLAKKLKVKVRSKIVLNFQDSRGILTGGAFYIEGIFKTNSSIFDETAVFVKRQDINRLTQLGNKSHALIIFLKNKDRLQELKTKIAKEFPGLTVESWKELVPDINYMTDFTEQILLIFLAVILLALAFGIVNSMLMAVLERINEIGMLAAIGMSGKKIFLMILMETVFITITGAAIGMLLGYVTIAYLKIHGLDLSLFSDGLESFGISAYIYPSLSLKYYIKLTVMVLITAFLSALYPAYKSLKLKPIQALRHIG